MGELPTIPLPAAPPARKLDDAYLACNPEQDLEGGSAHPFYVDLNEVRGGCTVMARIGRNIRRADGDPSGRESGLKTLVTGHRGSGKSTELNSLAADLRSGGYFVVEFDAESQLNIYDLGWPDLLIEISQQVFDQGSAARLTGDIEAAPDEGLLKEALRWLDRTTLTQLTRQTAQIEVEAGAGFKSPIPVLELWATFRSLLRAGSERTREIRRELEPRADQLMSDLNRFLEDFQAALRSHGRQGLVVVVDGLEKMSGAPGSEGADPYADLFIQHADNLKSPCCHVVYTMPIALLYDHNVGDRYGATPCILPMVKVRDREREPHAPGVQAMRSVLDRRAEVNTLFQGDAAERLCLASGGHVRDLLRLARAAFDTALDAGQTVVTPAAADRAITLFAQENYARMAYEALPELRQVYQSQLLSSEHGRLAQNLLVLEYWNDEQWNDLHPCVAALPRVQAALKDPPAVVKP